MESGWKSKAVERAKRLKVRWKSRSACQCLLSELSGPTFPSLFLSLGWMRTAPYTVIYRSSKRKRGQTLFSSISPLRSGWWGVGWECIKGGQKLSRFLKSGHPCLEFHKQEILWCFQRRFQSSALDMPRPLSLGLPLNLSKPQSSPSVIWGEDY